MFIKKTVSALILSVAAVAGVAQAADNAVSEITSGVYVENTNAGCSLLKDRVTVNLSNKVTMSYNCLVAAGKVNIGACHEAGSQKPTNIPCAVTGADANGDPTYSNAACTGVANQTFEISGRRAYVASTTGGAVSAADLNSATCNAAAISALNAITQ